MSKILSDDERGEYEDRILQLQAENKALRRPLEAANFKVDGMLSVGNELIEKAERIKELETENRQLTLYKEYVEAKISKGELPCSFQFWFQTVEELAKELEKAIPDTTKRQILKEHGIEYLD